MDMSLSKLWKMVKDREARRATVHGFSKSQTWLSDWSDLKVLWRKKWSLASEGEGSPAMSNEVQWWLGIHLEELLWRRAWGPPESWSESPCLGASVQSRMRAPGRLTVAGLVSRRPPPLPSAGAHRPGNHPWGGSAGSLPVEGAHRCLAARGCRSVSWAARSSELLLWEGNSAWSYAWGLSSLIIKLGQYLIYNVNTWHTTMKYLNIHVLKANSIPTGAS